MASIVKMIMKSNGVRGPVGPKLSDICLTFGEKKGTHFLQETCPNRESKPDPLRETRTHGGHI